MAISNLYMAKKIKDYYNEEWAVLFSKKIREVESDFDQKAFVDEVTAAVKGKEFSDRIDAIVVVLVKFLDDDYLANLELFRQILGPKLDKAEGMFSVGYWLWPVGRYVEKFGAEYEDESLEFIYELTQRFTGEFAIRPLLETNPKKVLKTMLKWSKDDSVHVRRLSSEGMRMRLPWAPKSEVFADYFDDAIKVLDNLKSDEYKFVQKSVGNTLNDLSKTNPEQVIETTDRWLKESKAKETEWIVKHALRTINKKK